VVSAAVPKASYIGAASASSSESGLRPRISSIVQSTDGWSQPGTPHALSLSSALMTAYGNSVTAVAGTRTATDVAHRLRRRWVLARTAGPKADPRRTQGTEDV
jgi:hypothetical protein